MQARISKAGLAELVSDYRYATTALGGHIRRALQMSASVLAAEPGELRGQLLGRLISNSDPVITAWARELAERPGPVPWLAPSDGALIPTTTALRQVLAAPQGPLWAMAMTADGCRAVTGGFDGKLRIWDLKTGVQKCELTGHSTWLTSVAITPDGALAVSGGWDGTVSIWDLASAEQRHVLKHGGKVSSVAISADGTRAISCGDGGAVRVWDVAAERLLGTFAGHTGMLRSVAMTPDGRRAVSAGDDGTVRVWDVATLDQQWIFPVAHHQPWQFPETSSTIQAVAITPDGQYAVSGGNDWVLRVWNLADGALQHSLTAAPNTGFPVILAVAITDDGRRAVASGPDARVRVWDLVAGTQLQTLD
jgi:WD40 repeat protein